MTDCTAIDVHAHHYPQSYIDACLAPTSPFDASKLASGRVVVRHSGGIVLTIPTHLPSPAERLELLDQAGIRLQLLSVPSPSVYAFDQADSTRLAREVNEDLLKYAEGGDGRLAILLTLPLPDCDAAIREIDYWRAHPLVKGALICSHLAGTELDDDQMTDLWGYARATELPLLLHPTTPICATGYETSGLSISAGFMHEQSRALARLMFSKFAVYGEGGFGRLVVTHLGGGISSLAERLDVYWDRFVRPDNPHFPAPSLTLRALTYDVALNGRAALVGAAAEFSPSKIVLGTDFPHMPYDMRSVIETVRSVVHIDDVDNVLFRNASRLFDCL